MIGYSFKVTDAVQDHGKLLAVLFCQMSAAELHQIASQLILIMVNQIFQLDHTIRCFFIKLIDQLHGQKQSFSGISGHILSRISAMLKSKSRRIQETGVQKLDLSFCCFLGFQLFLGLRDRQISQLLQNGRKREHDYHRNGIKGRMEHCHPKRAGRIL